MAEVISQLLLRTWHWKWECLQLAVLTYWPLQYLQAWGRCGSGESLWSHPQEDSYPKQLISPQTLTDTVGYPQLGTQIGVCWWIKFWRYSLSFITVGLDLAMCKIALNRLSSSLCRVRLYMQTYHISRTEVFPFITSTWPRAELFLIFQTFSSVEKMILGFLQTDIPSVRSSRLHNFSSFCFFSHLKWHRKRLKNLEVLWRLFHRW